MKRLDSGFVTLVFFVLVPQSLDSVFFVGDLLLQRLPLRGLFVCFGQVCRGVTTDLLALFISEGLQDFHPSPTFRTQLFCGGFQFVRQQHFQQPHISEQLTLTIFAEEVCSHRATRFEVSVQPHQLDAIVIDLDLVLGQMLTDLLVVALPCWQRCPGLQLALLIITRGQHHDLIKVDFSFAELLKQIGMNLSQLHAALDLQHLYTMRLGDAFRRIALTLQTLVGEKLIHRVHGFLRNVFDQTDVKAVSWIDLAHLDHVVSRDFFLITQMPKTSCAATTCMY